MNINDMILTLLKSMTFWVLTLNFIFDFQVLQYMLIVLITWGTILYIRRMQEDDYDTNGKISYTIGHLALHIFLPIFILYWRQTFKRSLTLNNFLIGILVGLFYILMSDIDRVYDCSKQRVSLETGLLWVIIFFGSRFFIDKKLFYLDKIDE